MLRSIPLRLKLVTALVLPMLVVGGYLYFDINESIERRDVAAAQRDEVEVFQAVSDFASAIGAEHLLVSSRASDPQQLANARASSDAAYDALRGPDSDIAAERLQVVDGQYGSLLAIREQLGDDPTETRLRANIELRNGESRSGPYTTSLEDLAELPVQVLGAFDFDPTAIDDIATSGLVDDYLLIQRARADVRREASTLLRVATLPGNLVDAQVTESVAASIAETDESLEVLAQLASIDVAGGLDSMLVAPEWARYSGFRNAVEASRIGERVDVNEDELRAAADDVDDVLRVQSNEVVTELESRSSNSVFDANRDVVVSGLIGLWLIIGVGIVLRFLYRSIKRPLEKLTEQAGHVANEELPSVIEQMRRGEIESVPEIEMIPAETKDEVGKLVNAFNDMHRSAVDLAAGQAESRRVVADMFVNLGRRNQRLVGRLLNGLSTLEQHEQDPDKLAALYDLDHTATRMRRNAESLLVLAGAGQARRWDEPVAIHDIARAAIGEVESYQRVAIDVQGDERLDGLAVADVTHMLAELVENALTFSPPNSPVEIVAGSTTAGYVIAVTDHGIGMLPEQVQESNDRITGAAAEEESPSEFLGLYVVGRLAARHGIRVELSEGPAGGVTARAWIPSTLLIDPSILIPDASGGAEEIVGMPAPAAMPAPTGAATGASGEAATVPPPEPAVAATPQVAATPGVAAEPTAAAAMAIDPMLAPLGGTGPVEHAAPDLPETPLDPSSEATDFLSSLEAAGVQRRTPKLPSGDTPPPGPVEPASAPNPVPAATPDPAIERAADQPATSRAAPEPPAPVAAPVPAVAAVASASAAAEPGAGLASLVESVEASLEASISALTQPAAPRPAEIAPLSTPTAAPTAMATPEARTELRAAPAPTAPQPTAPSSTGAPAAPSVESPFEVPRRTPGANMPRTELIGSIVGSMGSIFGADAPSPGQATSSDAADATDQALAAVRSATASQPAAPAEQVAPAAPAAVADAGDLRTIDPDRVRAALSGFQQGIARADQESDDS